MTATLARADADDEAGRNEIGAPWTALDTPALLVDLDRLDANIAAMAEHASRGGVALRPHFKTHKSVGIARRQLAAGAAGITVATLDEAAAVVDGGLDTPILVAFQLTSPRKIDRAVQLARRARLSLAVDGAEGVRRLAAGADAAGATLDVWIEVDSGLHRCGVVPADAPALARVVVGHDSLHLGGMFTHAGQSYGAGNGDEVAVIAGKEAAAVVDAATATRAIGIPVDVVSAGSTPTARFLDGASGLTEIRPGTYVFQDALQVALGTADVHRCALTVAATVVSRPAPDRAVIDAGSKTLGLDKGAHSSNLLDDHGTLIGLDGSLVRLSEEHGVLRLPVTSTLAVGDAVRILPNHVCSVTNLGRRFHGLRDGVVAEIIPVDAAGGVH